ncbi:MAG: hypothetical protein SGARI_004304, partial [Bacillariaceae sp.]
MSSSAAVAAAAANHLVIHVGGDGTAAVASADSTGTVSLKLPSPPRWQKKRRASSYVMEKSPYENHRKGPRTAEHGELLFDKLRHCTDPYGAKQEDAEESDDDDDDDIDSDSSGPNQEEAYNEDRPVVHPELRIAFGGQANALVFVRAYHFVKKTGMSFHSNWVQQQLPEQEHVSTKKGSKDVIDSITDAFTNGFMFARTKTLTGRRSTGDGGEFARQLPKPVLVLCLQPLSLRTAQDVVLKQIILELDLLSLLSKLLKAWDLEEDFKKVATVCAMDDLPASKNKTSSYKCIIFVARVTAVLQLFERETWAMRDEELKASTLWKQVRKCLGILNELLQLNPRKVAEWKREQRQAAPMPLAAAADSVASTIETEPQDDDESTAMPNPLKRGRGRPRKRNISNTGVAEVSDTTATGSNSTSAAGKKQKKSGSRGVKRGGRAPPVPSIIGANLQQQHRQLGLAVAQIPSDELQRRHEDLGRAITSLRAEIQIDPEVLRAQWRQELRRE